MNCVYLSYSGVVCKFLKLEYDLEFPNLDNLISMVFGGMPLKISLTLTHLYVVSMFFVCFCMFLFVIVSSFIPLRYHPILSDPVCSCLFMYIFSSFFRLSVCYFMSCFLLFVPVCSCFFLSVPVCSYLFLFVPVCSCLFLAYAGCCCLAFPAVTLATLTLTLLPALESSVV